MGSSHNRVRGIDLVARCCYGVFYAVGFLTTTIVIMTMLWILWCYFGTALLHMSEGQRRAVVHYSLPSSKPQASSTSALDNQGDDALKSISKSVTTSSSFQRGSSRDPSITSTRLPGDSLSDDDDGIQLRRVATSNDNRHDVNGSPKDKSGQRTRNIESPNVRVQHPNSTSDAVGASPITRNITSSKAERRDEIQSSRIPDVGTTRHDLGSKTGSSHSDDRTLITEDDDRGSRSRYDAKNRGSDRKEDSDNGYSKGDTRSHTHHGEGSHADHPRRRSDDDRYADYDDTYKSHGDRPYYGDDRHRTYEGRHRTRDDERYSPRDDDRYRSRDEERYSSRDGEDGSMRTDRLKDHGRDTSRVDDRYRTRDMDRSRVDDRYITRDDDEDRYRDDDRYRDEGKSRTRYRDDERSRYGDNYRPRGGYRDRNADDFYSERGSHTRYSERDGYHTRGDEDRYRDDYRTKERDYRDPVIGSRDDTEDYSPRDFGAGHSNSEVPSRTISSESRYKNADRDDGYKRPSTSYDSRDRISPTRVRDDTYSSRATLIDSRSRPEPALIDSRRTDDDGYSQGSRRYPDDSRREYRTRMPDENTRYAPRHKDDSALERRSYGSEEDDEYTSRTRYYDDRSGTRRYFRNRDDEYPRGSRPDDDEEYTRRRTEDDEEYPRRRAGDDEEYSRRRTDDEEDFRRSRPRGHYDTTRTRNRDTYEERSRDDDRYDGRYDDRSRRHGGEDVRKEGDVDSSTYERPSRGSEKIDSRDTPKRPDDSSRRSDSDISSTPERHLSAKEVIEAALRQSDVNDKNADRKVSYPVFDPRVSNITSSDIIRPSERKGITIHSRKRRWLRA